MRKNNPMKKYTTFLLKFCLVMFVFVTSFGISNLYAQENKLSLEIVTVSPTNTNSRDGQIKIVVSGNAQNYSYALFDKEPWNQGKILDYADNIAQTEYTFINLSSGSYFVCVTDSEDNSVCENTNLQVDQE